MEKKESKEPLFVSGHTACAGCGGAIAIRQIMKALGSDCIIVNPTSCAEIFSSKYPDSAWNVPYIHVNFENAASVAAGIAKALEVKGNDHTVVACIAGDGSSYDIGFGAVSGALERNDNILYICYDNEAYMNCLSTSSLIMTENGLKKITEVKEGDKIYAFDQRAHKPVLKKCTGVFNNGKREIFELETLHHSIRATSNHPFLVLKRNGRGRQNGFIWKTLGEIKQNDEIVVLKKLDMSESYQFPPIKKTKVGDYKVTHVNEVKIPLHSTPDLMKYLGIYVGDGWIREKRGEVGFALPNGTRGRKALIKLHSAVFGPKIKSDEMYVYVNSVNLARFIDSLGFGKGAKNKTIPSWVFALPKNEKEAFIKGLMLSDGYKINNSSRYVSASSELLRRLRLLLQTMGYRVGKIHWQEKKKGAKCVKRKLLKDAIYGYICFSKRRKWNTKEYHSQYKYQNFLIGNENFEMEKVKKMRSVGKGPTLDLRVKDEHNFISDGIVVHNTGIQRSGATPFGAWTTTSQVGKKIKGKMEWKKPLGDIVAAHSIPYMGVTSIAYPADVEMKVKKAAGMKGARFILIHSPCTTGWRYKPELTVKIARLAVETGLWKMYEVEDGKEKVSMQPKFTPVEEYLKLQKRFKHLTDETIAFIQKKVNDAWHKT